MREDEQTRSVLARHCALKIHWKVLEARAVALAQQLIGRHAQLFEGERGIWSAQLTNGIRAEEPEGCAVFR
jgi:hypothetical protein